MPKHTILHGRRHELGALRTSYDRSEASFGWVTGLPGVGKTATVRRAAADFNSVYHRAAPLSDPQQRSALATTLGLTEELESPPTWKALFDRLVRAADEARPTVLVVDDAHRWLQSRSRFAGPLGKALLEARERGRPVHVTLLAPEAPDVEGAHPAQLPTLRLQPLTFRAGAAMLPGPTVADRLAAYGVFGGLPRLLVQLDGGASLGTNLRRLVLSEGARFRDMPLDLLERSLQVPARYAAILSALADGEGEWRVVREGVPDLSSSGQAGPYLKRLQEMGLVEARRSLDAQPRTRSRRYRITDPFVAFWFRFVLPHRGAMSMGEGDRIYSEEIRRALPHHTASIFPQACRDFMRDDAAEILGANARETGSLWGSDYDIPVAGVLASGAPFYGATISGNEVGGADSPLAALDRQVRETRYGFGRERRWRLLFLGGAPRLRLVREVARRDDTRLISLEDLAG